MLCGGTGGTAPPGTTVLTSGLALFSAVGYGQNISYILLKSFTLSRCEWSAGCGLEAAMKKKRIPSPIGNKIPIVQYLALLQFVDNIFGALAKLRKATVSSVVSVRPSSGNNSSTVGWIIMRFYT